MNASLVLPSSLVIMCSIVNCSCKLNFHLLKSVCVFRIHIFLQGDIFLKIKSYFYGIVRKLKVQFSILFRNCFPGVAYFSFDLQLSYNESNIPQMYMEQPLYMITQFMKFFEGHLFFIQRMQSKLVNYERDRFFVLCTVFMCFSIKLTMVVTFVCGMSI